MRERISIALMIIGVGLPTVSGVLMVATLVPPDLFAGGFIIGIGIFLIGLMLLPRSPIPPGMEGKMCPGCLYDLRGIDSEVCPECGAEREPKA